MQTHLTQRSKEKKNKRDNHAVARQYSPKLHSANIVEDGRGRCERLARNDEEEQNETKRKEGKRRRATNREIKGVGWREEGKKMEEKGPFSLVH